MRSNSEISVIIRVFNGENTIAETIKSRHVPTLAVHEDLNDGVAVSC